MVDVIGINEKFSNSCIEVLLAVLEVVEDTLDGAVAVVRTQGSKADIL
jgi:hypothetical protein